MIVIIDYGIGNLRSIQSKFERFKINALISSNIDDIKNATKLILPGVGSFQNGMKNLKEYGLLDILNQRVLEDKTPILGICLGMQLMAKGSEEGDAEGLGWFDAETVKFKFGSENSNLKIPHMGWNEVKFTKESKLCVGIETNLDFYFVHSYHVKCNVDSDNLAMTDYGYEFTSMIQKDNIYGAQFHPEKSHKHGVTIFKNFVENI
ncbi:MAG: imidazole glycerol phosphate synthase subunit HisH [Calditrichaeota bacterium]|nr:MAG: imidazole glycerol phosphate synthase subunit HisH [Calditrichota bacterium]